MFRKLLAAALPAVLICSVSFAAYWEVANTGLTGYSVADIAISQSDPNVLYCSLKNGVYKSTNAGASWYLSSSNMGATPMCGQICIDPTDASRIYVQGSDQNGARYVWRSDNHGVSWQLKANGINYPYIRAIAASKSSPGLVYCGTIIGGDSGGCYRSWDRGDHWTLVAGDRVPGSGLENDCCPLVVDPTDSERVYCGRTYYPGFIRSTDAGSHWTWTDASYVVRGIAVNPDQPNRIVAVGEGRLKLSVDYGVSFTTKVVGPSFQAVAHAPSDSNILYATTVSSGIYKSTDAGDTWQQVAGSDAYSWGRISVSPASPSIIYCVAQGRGVVRSSDGGQSFLLMNSGLPTELAVGYIQEQPGTGVTYALVNYVGFFRSFDQGATWRPVSSMNAFPRGFVIHPQNPAIMYYIAWPVADIFRSTDGGFTWSRLPTAPGADYYESIAVDPTNPNRIFVSGNNTDRVYRTTDGGQSWQVVHTLTASPDWWNVVCWGITVDPTNPQRVYLATYNHPWRSDDGGYSWVKLDTLHYPVWYGGVLKDTSFIRQIAVDPVSPNIVYASTQWGGTWRSLDYGDHWTKIWDYGGSTTNNTVVDSRDHNTIYISTLGSAVQKFNGTTWTQMSSGLQGNDTYPNVVFQSLANPNRLYVGANGSGVYRTPGGGWGITIDQARSLPDGAYCALSEDPIVSQKYSDGAGCVQNTDRLRGIRVTNLGAFVTGDRLRVAGTLRSDGPDRYMQIDTAYLSGRVDPPNAIAIGSAALGQTPAPVGVYSRVWGSVIEVGPGGDYSYLDAGSTALDPAGHRGVKIVHPDVPALKQGSFAVLEGILGFSVQDGQTVPCLHLHDVGGILLGDIGNYLCNVGFETADFTCWNLMGTAAEIAGGSWHGMNPRSGTYFVGAYAAGATKSGVIYQTVQVLSGREHQASVWSRVYHDRNVEDSAMNRIGVDPTGGVDPLSPSVLWSDWDTQPLQRVSYWKQLFSPAFLPSGCWCTVFLEYKQQNDYGFHINCFDDAALTTVP